MQHRTRNSTVPETKQRKLKINCLRKPYLYDAEKTVGELELLAVAWGLERFRFFLYGKQIQLFSDHQAIEQLLKKTNQTKSAVPD